MTNSESLAQIQRWMQTAIQDPTGSLSAIPTQQSAIVVDSRPTAIADVITRSTQMSAAERLEIYRHAYTARLVDCLESEFPAVRFAAGAEAFAGLAIVYLHSHPSRSDTLSALGAHFADYLQKTRPARDEKNPEADFAEFLIELARLERIYAEIFDGPGPEQQRGLLEADLSQLSADKFAASKIAFHDSVRLITLQFPGHEFASAVRQGQEPPPPAPAETLLVVFRRDYVVRRMAVTPFQFALLSGLESGATISEALASAARDEQRVDDLRNDVRTSFATWTAAPLFRELIR